MWYQWLSGLITATGLVGCLAFVSTYWSRTRGAWYDSAEGRYLMTTNSILGSLFMLILSTQIFGDWPGRRVVAVLLYTLYAGFTWWLHILMLRATRRRGG